jgi:dTDP-4-amino-4,6-dideoxygalactose transaminase
MTNISPFEEPVYVTRPFLPPLSEYCGGLQSIWRSGHLTNDGPILKQFEVRLADYFKTDKLSIFTNGTLALQIGLQGLEISGEVITTPFTFVATTHALYWNKIRPVFCDIEPDTYTIDPDKIEKLITPWTTAILAVHVFGHPCDVEKLEHIARKHNLILIYDAAHAFGETIDGRPITDFGDLVMLSFHATKIFHSLEGGMLTVNNPSYLKTLYYLKNFGFKNQTEVVMPGTNAKMNELQALMGMTVLKYMPRIIDKHKTIYEQYLSSLDGLQGVRLPRALPDSVEYNYSYFPVEIDESLFGISRDALFEKLQAYNVFARRYFYPLVNDFYCYRHIELPDPLTVARGVADRILNLPMYNELELHDVEKICAIIRHIQAAG